MKRHPIFSSILTLVIAALVSPVLAAQVNLTEYLPYLDVEFQGKTIRIERIQDTDNALTFFYREPHQGPNPERQQET
jgi:hypothetical protein